MRYLVIVVFVLMAATVAVGQSTPTYGFDVGPTAEEVVEAAATEATSGEAVKSEPPTEPTPAPPPAALEESGPNLKAVAEGGEATTERGAGSSATASAVANVNVPVPQIRVVRVSGGGARTTTINNKKYVGSGGRQPVVVNNNIPVAEPPTIVINTQLPAVPVKKEPVEPAKKERTGMIIALWIVAGLGAGLGVCGLIALCTQGGRLPQLVEALTNGGERQPGMERIRIAGSRTGFRMTVEPANATPVIPSVAVAPPQAPTFVTSQYGVATVQVPVSVQPVVVGAVVPTPVQAAPPPAPAPAAAPAQPPAQAPAAPAAAPAAQPRQARRQPAAAAPAAAAQPGGTP